MRRWVAKHEDGTLAIITTSTDEMPDWALCEAHDDWVSDELTFSDGIVFVDKKKIEKKNRKEITFIIEPLLEWWPRYKNKILMSGVVLISIALGYFLNKVL